VGARTQPRVLAADRNDRDIAHSVGNDAEGLTRGPLSSTAPMMIMMTTGPTMTVVKASEGFKPMLVNRPQASIEVSASHWYDEHIAEGRFPLGVKIGNVQSNGAEHGTGASVCLISAIKAE
jgi:hypothetical protein